MTEGRLPHWLIRGWSFLMGQSNASIKTLVYAPSLTIVIFALAFVNIAQNHPLREAVVDFTACVFVLAALSTILYTLPYRYPHVLPRVTLKHHLQGDVYYLGVIVFAWGSVIIFGLAMHYPW